LVFIITVLSFLLNFSWELIQIPLYKDSSYSIDHIAFCALASVADALMVLLLYFSFALIFKNLFWIIHIKWQHVVILILIGGTGAVLAEIRHLSLGTWAYADSMQIIPIVNVGLPPVLQFMILPSVVYFVSLLLLKRYEKKITDYKNYGIN